MNDTFTVVALPYLDSFFSGTLSQILTEESLYLVKGNLLQVVIQVGMYRSRDDEQTFIVSLQLLVDILAEVARVSFLAMHQHHGTAYLARVR